MTTNRTHATALKVVIVAAALTALLALPMLVTSAWVETPSEGERAPVGSPLWENGETLLYFGLLAAAATGYVLLKVKATLELLDSDPWPEDAPNLPAMGRAVTGYLAGLGVAAAGIACHMASSWMPVAETQNSASVTGQILFFTGVVLCFLSGVTVVMVKSLFI